MKKNIIKRIGIIVPIASIVMCFAGCSVDEDNKTTFELSKDGKIKQVIVDDNTVAATGEDIETYINAELTKFQQENTQDSISLEKCRVSNEKVNIELTYSSPQAYAQFNYVKCYDGTIRDAYNAGYNFNKKFFAANGAVIPFFELPELYSDCKVLIVQEPMTVTLPGKLVAYSEGVTVANNVITIDPIFDTSVDEELRNTTLTPAFLIYR